jgi:protein-S-isoprenylcysteine O-methyltransferase Ste14
MNTEARTEVALDHREPPGIDSLDQSRTAATARVRGHGKALGKLRLDRGPLRWWLMVIGLMTIQYVAWRFALGAVLVTAGALLHVVSKGYLRPGRNFLNRTKAITTRGPYRFIRNPFYLANLLAEVGLLIIIGRLWIAVIYLPIWAWVYCKTILEEERKLTDLCGEVYARYCGQVPRLFPVPWKFRPKVELSGPRFSWKNPHIAEGNEIQRALRLVSYPCLLRTIVAGMNLPSWSAVLMDPTIIVFASAFVILNTIGWLITPMLRRLRRSKKSDDAGASGQKTQSSRRARRWAALLFAAVSLGVLWAGTQYKYYFWPKRFRVVETEQIYRGGWQTPRILRRILQDYHIRTVLNVACNPPEPEAAGEGTVVRQCGVRWLKILMPGTGLGTIDQLDEAADILADPQNRPIFIHCAAGVHRTNMSLAAYRLKHCGWSLHETIDEMVLNGYDRQNDLEKVVLLRNYIEHLENSHVALVR